MVADAGRSARHEVEGADRPIDAGQITATAGVGQGETQRGCQSKMAAARDRTDCRASRFSPACMRLIPNVFYSIYLFCLD